MDCEHFKARLEAVQADSLREKKEKLALRQQLQEARQQLQQQAEYCTEMGAAACTLLWGVSSREEVVTAILGGDKALKFFSITGQTMESFVKSLDGDVREPDSDENQFVFALAGIVTNVAAIACGREFLVNSSRVLLDTMLQLLGDLKPGQCTKLKVLLLMALYNVSINLKGLRYISESPGFIPLLWWLLSGHMFQKGSWLEMEGTQPEHLPRQSVPPGHRRVCRAPGGHHDFNPGAAQKAGTSPHPPVNPGRRLCFSCGLQDSSRSSAAVESAHGTPRV
ncbi:heat shock factor 2-binding protein isoform X4 [Pteropus alecto]|nr:heat shock factor 2-binding protein isoform X4 [Pteropus alecto]